jgi:hypothetical protein
MASAMYTVITTKRLRGPEELQTNYDKYEDSSYITLSTGNVETISEEDLIYRFAMIDNNFPEFDVNLIGKMSREIGLIINADGSWSSANTKAEELDQVSKIIRDSALLIVAHTHTYANVLKFGKKLESSDCWIREPLDLNKYLSVESKDGLICMSSKKIVAHIITSAHDIKHHIRRFHINLTTDEGVTFTLCSDHNFSSNSNYTDDVYFLTPEFINNEFRQRRHDRQGCVFQLDACGALVTKHDRNTDDLYYLCYNHSSDKFTYKRIKDFDHSDSNFSTVKLENYCK